MKHLKHLFTALLMLCATTVAAHDFEVGGIYYNILSEENKTVKVTYKGTSYSEYSNEYSGSVVIPQSVTYNGSTYSVTSIDSSAFKGCTGLTSIEIPNSVTRFRDEVFSGCTGLTNIEIPNSVTSIGEWAFKGCTGLTSIEIPNSVTRFGDEVFSGCTGLTSIEIPNGVSLGERMFRGCSNLERIVDHREDITSYGNAFSHCNGLKSFEIPNSVTYVGAKAFRECTGLTSIVIPDCVYYIGEQAFYNCSNLESVVLPNSLKCIESYTFYFCTNLASVVIPNSVTSIGINAFESCRNLTSVVIPSSVTSLAYMAFGGCTGLTSVTSLIPAENLFGVNLGAFKDVDKNACTLYVPYGAKETYASTEGWNEFANIVELEPTEVTVTIGQYGNATYCSPYALDFSEVEGLKAYAATGYNKATQVVTLTRVQTAEAGVGLFLKGEPSEYVVPVIEYSNDYTLNLLVGTLEPTTVNSTDGAMSNYKFTIAEGDAAPMFYPFEDNTAFSAGKAYLQIPTAWLPVAAQKSLNIRFDDGETTDIDELKGESGEVKTIYDLQGRAVENPTSGIYIIDGKKVVIK